MRNGKHAFLIMMFVTLFLVGCEKSNEAKMTDASTKKINNVGAWVSYKEDKFGDESLEFFSDETCSIEIAMEGMVGIGWKQFKKRFGCQWVILDDGRIKLAINMVPAELIAFATVEDDRLSMDEGEKKTMWVRASSNDAKNLEIAIDTWNEGLPLYNKEKYSEAFPLIKKSAEHGRTEAQFYLGTMYKNGMGITEDKQEAFKWYQKAAEQGHLNSQVYVGISYNYGTNVVEDKKAAFKWFQKAAEHGHVLAQVSLANMYANGWGITEDKQEAFKWNKKAAEQGDVLAQNMVGITYLSGCDGFEQSCKKAEEWLLKATAQNYNYAHNILAWLYATCKDASYRDGSKAVDHGLTYLRIEKEDWSGWDTLAAAYARNGQFNDAIESQNKAIKLLKQSKSMAQDEKDKKLSKAEKFLALYKKKAPYVDETPECD